MNGETTEYLAQVKHSANEEVVSEDDDVPLTQRKQKPAENEGPDKKKIKLASSHNGERSTHNQAVPIKLKADIKLNQGKPHVNSVVKQEPNKSPVKKSPSSKSRHPPGVVIKRELTSPVKQFHATSGHPASDDDDDVPLVSCIICKLARENKYQLRNCQ